MLFAFVMSSNARHQTRANSEEIASLRSQEKGSPIGKPFQIVYVITQNVTGLPKGKYMMVMHVYSLFHCAACLSADRQK
jgi:hypothetical protein